MGLLFLPLMLVGCANENDNTATYKNPDFGFAVDYPNDYKAKESKWLKESISLELQKKGGTITLQAMGAGTLYEGMPFDQYVKIAASVEIQNFEKLISSESFVSDYGVDGYKTYWLVVDHEDTDKGSFDTTREAGPIYYFPPLTAKKLGDQPVKAIMLDFSTAPGSEKTIALDAEEIARSFRYARSLKLLVGQRHQGKKIYIETGKPFRLELTANPTTGFNWYLDDLDESYLKVKDSGYIASRNGRIGAPGVSYWEFMPLKEGNSVIRLLYYRSWEGKAKAVDKYQVKIRIR